MALTREKHNKVILGLHACVLKHGDCGNCPYYEDSSKLCEANLYADTTELIGDLSDEVVNLRMTLDKSAKKKAPAH